MKAAAAWPPSQGFRTPSHRTRVGQVARKGNFLHDNTRRLLTFGRTQEDSCAEIRFG
ncbi:Uncharacterised protein [Bordetella pertussis]|nr:Uncharacterised protein [Bordetella pertussis]